MKTYSQRQLRVGELIRHELAELIHRGEARSETLDKTPVTIAEVRMSPDLKLATAFIVPLGNGDPELILGELNQSEKALRGKLGRRLTMKFTPSIRFQLDTRFQDDARIDRLLHDVKSSKQPVHKV